MNALLLFALLAQTPAGFPDATAQYDRFSAQVLAAYDSARGGFVTKAAVPVESAVELAFLRAGGRAQGEWAGAALRTLEWSRGLFDTLSGGYVHGGHLDESESGALDKRADSNGRRLELLIEAWQLTHDDSYRRTAARLVDWADRVLLDGRGGFVSAQVGDRELEPAPNGAMLHAWIEWAAATRDARRRDFALRSLDRVWDECWVERLGLVRKNGMGDIAREPRLVDQAEMGRAYVLAASRCGRAEDRERARQLGDLLLQRFQEPGGGFRTQAMPDKNGAIKKAKAVAAENARAMLFLCELSALTGADAYRDAAARAMQVFAKSFEKMDLAAADWALAVHASYAPGLPGRVEWVAEARDREPPKPRSVRFKTGKR